MHSPGRPRYRSVGKVALAMTLISSGPAFAATSNLTYGWVRSSPSIYITFWGLPNGQNDSSDVDHLFPNLVSMFNTIGGGTDSMS